MKNGLEHLDHRIRQWHNITKRYPLSDGYKEVLYKLQNERDLLASLIGKKKKRA